jgi:Fe-S oxidoreductase
MSAPVDRELDLCTFCPNLCLDVCPVARASGNAALTPWGKMSILRHLSRGLVSPDDETVLPLYHCVGCLACTNLCGHAQPVAERLFAARGRYARPAAWSAAAEAPRPLQEAFAQVSASLPSELQVEEAQVAYLPGVEVLEDAPEVIEAVFRVFAALGVDEVGFTHAAGLDDGAALREAGDLDGARAQGAALARTLSRYRKVVVHGAHLLYMLRTWLPLQGISCSADVVPLVDFLADRIAWRDARDAAPEASTLAVHDACLWARGGGDPQAARALLTWAAGGPPRELVRHGEDAWCCGRGARYHQAFPELAARMAARVGEEARLVGVDRVVSTCAAAAASLRRAGVPAVDMLTYLDQRLSEGAHE